MTLFKRLIPTLVITAALSAASTFANGNPAYDKVLNGVHEDMKRYLLQFNDSDPFVTATPISGFVFDATPNQSFFNHRDTFFKIKFLGLQNTNDLIGYIAFTDNMREDAMKMLAHLSNSVRNQSTGSWRTEKDKLDKHAADKLITPTMRAEFLKACKERHAEDAVANYDCDKELADKLDVFTRGTLYTVFKDNYELVNQIFEGDAYYQTLELVGAYQYIQLVLLEVLANQNYISSMQQEFMDEKRDTQLKLLSKNLGLTEIEKRRETALVNHRYLQSMDYVMKRRDSTKADYAKRAEALRLENQQLALKLDRLHREFPESFSGLNNDDECSYLKVGKMHRRCKLQVKVNDEVQRFVTGTGERYIGLPELPFSKDWKRALKKN